MIYLVSGSTKTLRSVVQSRPGRFGFLFTPNNKNRPSIARSMGMPWALDNGAFSGFAADTFRSRLARDSREPGGLFVVCPDVVGDAKRTLGLFHEWRDEVFASGIPVAFVGQDGAENLDLPWDEFRCYFVGGSTAWKLSRASADLMLESKRRGKWLHMGRVNSLRRLRMAYDLGCDSVDGSSVSMYGEKYLPAFARWLDELHGQPTLFDALEVAQ